MIRDSTNPKLAPTVYGGGPPSDDPAEAYHEASKLQPATIGRELRGIALLERNLALQQVASRSVRRNLALPRIALPQARLGEVTLAEALAARRSARDFGTKPLSLEELATLLWSAYGMTGTLDTAEQRVRTVPSAGALYPLELYVAAVRVSGLERRIYHYDPFAHALELTSAEAELEGISPDPVLPGNAAAVVLAAAVFWRSRVKYGLRAYRFTVLEAGHAMQNLLLAAVARRLEAVVLGGFFDDRVDRLLGLDGVDESALVGACVGPR